MMRALRDIELESVAGGLMMADPGDNGGGGIKTSVNRDAIGNVTGAAFTSSFEGVNVNGSVGTENATVSASNGSLSSTVSYDHGDINVGVSGTATFNNVSATAGYDSSGNATGTLIAKAGDSTYSFGTTAESVSHDFGNGYTATVSYNNQSNSWSTAFSHDGSFLDCSFSGSLSSSGALGFGVNCAVDNSYLGF